MLNTLYHYIFRGLGLLMLTGIITVLILAFWSK